MISYPIYKLIHLISISAILLGLGGAFIGARTSGGKPESTRLLVALTHGIGMLFALIAGFGMIARLGLTWPYPWWVFGKVVIWLALGLWLSFSYRRATQSLIPWFGALLLVALAAGLVLAR